MSREDLIGKGIGGHHSPQAIKDEWLTPPPILAPLGEFDLDPCAPVSPPWRTARQQYSENGLEQEWRGRVWCNPPYGRETGKWLKKCSEHGNCIVLIFARVETKDWFENIWPKAHSVLFLEGRLYFHHVDGTRAENNSGAPSALVAYGSNNVEVLNKCGLAGKHLILK